MLENEAGAKRVDAELQRGARNGLAYFLVSPRSRGRQIMSIIYGMGSVLAEALESRQHRNLSSGIPINLYDRQ